MEASKESYANKQKKGGKKEEIDGEWWKDRWIKWTQEEGYSKDKRDGEVLMKRIEGEKEVKI